MTGHRILAAIALVAGAGSALLAGGGPAGAHRDADGGSPVRVRVKLEKIVVTVESDASRYARGTFVGVLNLAMRGHRDSATSILLARAFKIDHPVGKPFTDGREVLRPRQTIFSHVDCAPIEGIDFTSSESLLPPRYRLPADLREAEGAGEKLSPRERTRAEDVLRDDDGTRLPAVDPHNPIAPVRDGRTWAVKDGDEVVKITFALSLDVERTTGRCGPRPAQTTTTTAPTTQTTPTAGTPQPAKPHASHATWTHGGDTSSLCVFVTGDAGEEGEISATGPALPGGSTVPFTLGSSGTGMRAFTINLAGTYTVRVRWRTGDGYTEWQERQVPVAAPPQNGDPPPAGFEPASCPPPSA